MALRPWTYGETEELVDTGIFRLLREPMVSPRTGREGRCVRLATPSWVNVVGTTASGEILLVRQWRHGVREFTLEIPGGMIDPGESPEQAGARELREETGYVGDPPVLLGTVEPNPAIQDTRCHTVLIGNCRLAGDPEPDDGEDLEVELRPAASIGELVASGQIAHALVICAFWWFEHRPDS